MCSAASSQLLPAVVRECKYDPLMLQHTLGFISSEKRIFFKSEHVLWCYIFDWSYPFCIPVGCDLTLPLLLR
jgi:hypothetical protein